MSLFKTLIKFTLVYLLTIKIELCYEVEHWKKAKICLIYSNNKINYKFKKIPNNLFSTQNYLEIYISTKKPEFY